MNDLKVGRIEQLTHTPGPWSLHLPVRGYAHSVMAPHASGSRIACADIPQGLDADGNDALANARLIAAAPELLDDAKANDNAFTWLAEQMNSITDNAKHWNVAQIEALAQDLRIGIERNQKRTRAAIAKAEGR